MSLIRARSPYGIHTPAVHPAPAGQRARPNWAQALLHLGEILFPNRSRGEAQRMIAEANSGQVVATDDSYDTKLRSSWHTGARSDDITPVAGSSLVPSPPWPVGNYAGSEHAQQFSAPHANPQAASPMYHPGDQAYRGLHSASDHRSEAFFPMSGGRPEFGLDFGKPPWRVPCIRKPGMSLMAGVAQVSSQQWYAGVAGVGGAATGSLIVAPPAWADVTRGTRSVSGILQRVQGTGRERVPAVYVPREVR